MNTLNGNCNNKRNMSRMIFFITSYWFHPRQKETYCACVIKFALPLLKLKLILKKYNASLNLFVEVQTTLFNILPSWLSFGKNKYVYCYVLA